MVRKLRLIVWTSALVALWVSAEQGAFTTPPEAVEIAPAAPVTRALPESSWEKLRTLFVPAPAETTADASRKERP